MKTLFETSQQLTSLFFSYIISSQPTIPQSYLLCLVLGQQSLSIAQLVN